MAQQQRRAIDPHYHEDPDWRRPSVDLIAAYGRGDSDIHPVIGERFNRAGLVPVLDIGCGPGTLAKRLAVPCVGIDRAAYQLSKWPGDKVLGDAATLPFPSESFGGAAALYMLYHLDEPRAAVAEVHRVLRTGGLFAVCAPSRYDSPELAGLLPPEDSTFSSEDIPDVLSGYFNDIDMHPWDMPFYELPHEQAIVDYLHRYPALSVEEMWRIARRLPTPLTITKRGAYAFARKAERPA